MTFTFEILAYGDKHIPDAKGKCIATTFEESEATDICKALAMKYIGQWFGFAQTDNGPAVRVYSNPIRLNWEIDK